MFIHSRLTQDVSGIIMPIVRRTDCIKPRMVLACMCWLRLCGVGTRAERIVWMQVFDCINTVLSVRVPTPHNRNQHIQANTICGFIQSVLLTMDIMMPETCWVNPLKPNDLYMCRTAQLTSRCCIHFIYLFNKYNVLHILNMLHNLRFFSSKCRLFHKANFFGSCIIHILNTGCTII